MIIISKKIAYVKDTCVSCGACVKVCPFNAITILNGIVAKVDAGLCVGCAKCAKECPANTIEIVDRSDLFETTKNLA